MTHVPQIIAAIRAKDIAAVEAMCAAEPALRHARGENGVSLICLAVYMGQPAIAAALAQGRSDLDLFEACTLGDVARVRALIADDPVAVGALSPDGFHPLGYACFFGHRPLFDLLVAAAADVQAPARNSMRVQPLHSAVATGDEETALYMARTLLHLGADVNAVQAGGFTPLHEAAQRGHAGLVELLLAHGADPAARNEAGADAVEIAAQAGHEAVKARLQRRVTRP
jgi:ankyrin repeat protein